MTPEQAARVLAVAGAYDARLTPPSHADAMARAVAWAEALHSEMPPEWAVREVIRHYAEQTGVLMPAHLNTAWRLHRRAEAERKAARAAIDVPPGVPMPDEVRSLWQQIAAKAPQ